jgi:hypothetical protein
VRSLTCGDSLDAGGSEKTQEIELVLEGATDREWLMIIMIIIMIIIMMMHHSHRSLSELI